MKNKEKYAKEIVEIACSGGKLAMRKDDKCLTQCSGLRCPNCYFGDTDSCDKAIQEWAESEYIKKPVISKRDRAFLEYLNVNIGYITRDMDCSLFAYISKPRKNTNSWISNGELCKSLRMLNIDFPMIKWSDDEPWLIEDLKNLEVVEEYE